MPHEQQSLVQAGRKQRFLWVKISIRTLKKNLVYVCSSAIRFLRVLGGVVQGQIFKDIQARSSRGIKWTSLTIWVRVWFPPSDDVSFIPYVLRLQALDKKHFLLACVISSTTKTEPGITKYRLYCTARVCMYPSAHARCLSSNLSCPFLALLMSS